MKKSSGRKKQTRQAVAQDPRLANINAELAARGSVINWQDVGERLIRIRHVLGYPGRNQAAFAKRYGFVKSTWGGYETGELHIPALKATLLMLFLDGLDLNWIYFGRTGNLPRLLRDELAAALDRDRE